MADNEFTFSSDGGNFYMDTGNSIAWSTSGTTGTTWEMSTTADQEEKHVKAMAAGTVRVDEKKGIVEAFAAAIGNKDSVGDIIAPKAFDGSLQRRKPRVVWGHNWNEPVGKVLEIYEVGPNDSRLPHKMKSAGVGGLYVKVQFNLASERGREAFASVAFFGEDQEWSIGYKTIKSQFDPGNQANVLTEVELYEVSPVLHGANQLTGTVSVKSDLPVVTDQEFEAKGYENPHLNHLASALSSFQKRPVRVRFVHGRRVIFDTPDSGPMLSTISIGDEGQMTFSEPQPIRMRVVVAPLNAPMKDAPGRMDGDGCCKKSDGYFEVETTIVDDLEEKVGRVTAGRNVARLRQAVEMIQQVINDGMPETPEEGVEEKKSLDEAPASPDSAPEDGLYERFVSASKESGSDEVYIDGQKNLSGLVVAGVINEQSQWAEATELLVPMAREHNVSMRIPTPQGVDNSGSAKVEAYLPEGENLGTLSAELMAKMEEAGVGDVTFESLDFFGLESKSFNEAVLSK